MNFETVVTGAPMGIVASDADGGTHFANAAAEQLFGRHLAEARLRDFLPYEESLPCDGAWHDTDGIHSARGTFPLFVLGFPLSKEGVELTVRFIDLPGRSGDVDETISKADFDRLIRAAAHDLQEPLRMVSAYTELLAHRYGDKLEADAGEFLRFAADGARRMEGVVADLLAYTRLWSTPARIAPCDAHACATDAVARLDKAVEDAGARIRIDPMPRLRADPARLTQLFEILIGNAIKFRGEEPPVVRVQASIAGKGWHFVVEDNGIGIDPRLQEAVFEPFQRLHPIGKYPGTGMGLAISREIMRSHRGHIWVDAAPGGGSRFHFTIPDGTAPGGAAERVS